MFGIAFFLKHKTCSVQYPESWPCYAYCNWWLIYTPISNLTNTANYLQKQSCCLWVHCMVGLIQLVVAIQYRPLPPNFHYDVNTTGQLRYDLRLIISSHQLLTNQISYKWIFECCGWKRTLGFFYSINKQLFAKFQSNYFPVGSTISMAAMFSNQVLIICLTK